MYRTFYFYFRIYKRFGFKAIVFLVRSKFKRNKLEKIFVNGLSTPITLSNYGPDVTTLFQIFYAGEYDFDTKEPPRFIIDCGANIGLSAVFFANKYPDAKLVAIEPDKANFKFLLLNTKKYPNITCLQKAVWPQKRNLTMVDAGRGNWGMQTINATQDSGDKIEAITIDEIMHQFEINMIDLIKIDIEGAEKELFTYNYKNWLSKTNVIAIELHDFLDPTISSVFYKAIEPYRFRRYQLGENLILEQNFV